MKLILLTILFAAAMFGQSATCTPYSVNGQLAGDHCTITLPSVPAAGSVVIYWVSGTVDINGNVVPWPVPLDFHGSKSISYGGPTVGSITYNGAVIYTWPVP